MDNMILLSGMIHESLVNGPQLRRGLFAQICKHNLVGALTLRHIVRVAEI